MLEACDPEKTLLMLSGGVESTTLLFTMLRLGFKPVVMSWTGGSGRFHQEKYKSTRRNPGATDYMRAQSIAQTYNLDFVTFDAQLDDPDDYAQHCLDTPVTSRPSFEVSYLYRQMASFAHANGFDFMFSGIGEGNLQGGGRKNVTLGSEGRLSAYDLLSNHAGVLSVDSDQIYALSDVCWNEGVSLMTPYAVWGAILRYAGVPWHVMNTPRLKWITGRHFSAEYREICYKPYTAAMQSRDASTREDFDSLILESGIVQDILSDLDTSNHGYVQAWYNYCSKRHGAQFVGAKKKQPQGRHDESIDIRTTDAMLAAVDSCQDSVLKLAAQAVVQGRNNEARAMTDLYPYVLNENCLIVASGLHTTDRAGAMKLPHEALQEIEICNLPDDIDWWDGESIDFDLFAKEALASVNQ